MLLFCRETNLKVKQCLDETNALGEDERSLSEFCGHILCEPPNNNLGRQTCDLCKPVDIVCLGNGFST
jgi:hypothetical protein